MSVRVIARIRPPQQSEVDRDIVLSAANTGDAICQPTLVKIPNPKNAAEIFTYQFSSIYDHFATQQQIFENEVSPTIKHLFNGFDVTIFAYGSTGTGKTHTMRGGKTLAERGIIPRLLSGIYRRARRIDKESAGKTTVKISLSYYEIYNDKVFDLFEAPEKRTLAGLPLRDNGGKIVVVGLTERPCESLKEFERLYDQANINRSTSATKLNVVSSRSHAILGIKLAVMTGEEVRISTASAIDLAGSEDNRRTENGKERMVESASINKSLFVLAKCVEAISSDSARIPYRESKMTRILSLGQNNGLTIMILNLAPTRAFHLDIRSKKTIALSSLNFANRTKKIEVREIENEPIFKGCSRALPTCWGNTIDRQPLRPLANTVHNSIMNAIKPPAKQSDKQTKAFSVYLDKNQRSSQNHRPSGKDVAKSSSPRKRPSDLFTSSASRPSKRRSPNKIDRASPPTMSKEAIEDIIERKVRDILAARALDHFPTAPQPEISEEVQRRLAFLEQKIDGKDDGREQGLTFLLIAKQHAVRGEYASALRMYQLAKSFFPDNEKLDLKIEKLQEKLREKRAHEQQADLRAQRQNTAIPEQLGPLIKSSAARPKDEDEDYQGEAVENPDYESDAGFRYRAKPKKARTKTVQAASNCRDTIEPQTPRTKQLLEIINGRDISQIRLLRGVGVKKAEAIVEALCTGEGGDEGAGIIHSLEQLGRLRGVSTKTVDAMRSGL